MSWFDDFMDVADNATDGGASDVVAQGADLINQADNVDSWSSGIGLVDSAMQAVNSFNDALHNWGLQPHDYDELNRQIAGNRSMWSSQDLLDAWQVWVYRHHPVTALSGDVWDEPFHTQWIAWANTQNKAMQYTGGKPVDVSPDGTQVNVGGKLVSPESLGASNSTKQTPNTGEGFAGNKAMLWVGAAAVVLLLFTGRKNKAKK